MGRGRKATPTRPARAERVRAWTREHGAFAAVLVGFVAYWLSVFWGYRVLPDGLFGGDMWQQFGIALHVYDGNPPWTDAAFAGMWAFRDWLMFVAVAGLARATATDPLRVAILWPVVPLALGGLAAYGLGRRLFGGRVLPTLLAAGWMGLSPHMGFQSSSLAAMCTVPFFAWALAAQDGTVSRRLLLGLAWGFASLSYLVAFFGTTLVLVGAGALALADAARRRRLREGARGLARAAAPVLAVGAPIVAALWAPLVLAYGGDVQNPSHLYAADGYGWSAGEAVRAFVGLFVATTDPASFVVHLGALAGVWAAVRRWPAREARVPILLLAAGLVGTYHYAVTVPLLGTHLVFFRWPKIFLGFAILLLFVLAVAHLAAPRRPGADTRWAPLAVAAIVVAAGTLTLTPDARPAHDAAARLDAPEIAAGKAFAAWVRTETPRDAVWLALDEESFALNGLTGRKVVVTRRTHANTFADMDRRMTDAAIMMHGEDRSRAAALMDAYGVTHAFVSWYGPTNVDVSPLAASPAFADEWRAAGVPFVERRAPLDPFGDAPTFDLIAVNASAPARHLAEFREAHRVDVAGEPYMTALERVRGTREPLSGTEE